MCHICQKRPTQQLFRNISPLPLPDALVLDLDGTLIDSAADLADAINSLLAERGLTAVSLDAVRGMIGDGLGMLAFRALTAAGAPPEPSEVPLLAARLLHHYIEPSRVPRTEVFPGVPETLAAFAAAGVKLGLCTNKAQAATELVLKKTDLERYLDCVIGQDVAPRPKPDAAHVEAVLSLLGSPGQAVMVGDSINDLKAGRAAGLPVILVTYGYGTPEALAEADATIDHFSDLPEALAKLGFTA